MLRIVFAPDGTLVPATLAAVQALREGRLEGAAVLVP